MLTLPTFRTGPSPCVYLPDRDEIHEHTPVLKMSADEYEAFLNDGWRKFGPLLYRPVCETCDQCRPLRIPVADFAPSRSQTRALRKNDDLTVTIASPTIDETRLSLYNRYHGEQEREKGWPSVEKTRDDYVFSFLRNPVPSREIALWLGETLLCVALVDITPNIVSGVYHYHDPGEKARSLGTRVMLEVIELGRQLGRTWAHFGYWVESCPSLSYKSNFRPCEIRHPDGTWVGIGS